MAMSGFTEKLIDNTGFVNPKLVAAAFHTTQKEVAQLSGLSIDAVSKQQRARSTKSQKRLLDLVLIINRVIPWTGSLFQAYAWYRSEPLPGFGDLTAETLVKQGHSAQIMAYLDRIAEGGFA